jgi:hypothetical protein
MALLALAHVELQPTKIARYRNITSDSESKTTTWRAQVMLQVAGFDEASQLSKPDLQADNRSSTKNSTDCGFKTCQIDRTGNLITSKFESKVYFFCKPDWCALRKTRTNKHLRHIDYHQQSTIKQYCV